MSARARVRACVRACARAPEGWDVQVRLRVRGAVLLVERWWARTTMLRRMKRRGRAQAVRTKS